MKASVRINPYATIATAIVLISATSALAESYGRAGGTVGADRIVQMGQTTVVSSLGDADFGKWYGNAGGPVGAGAIAQIAQAPVTPAGDVDFSRWYGRAGGPVGVATASAASAIVAHAK